MSTFKQYVIAKPGKRGREGLKLVENNMPSPKGEEVLVKIHAVSLQYRDLFTLENAGNENVTPCSDMAGEVVSVGENVVYWEKGQRVCANFKLDHLDGDSSQSISVSALGSTTTPGVLAEYRVFPSHSLVEIPEHLSYQEAATLPCAALTAYAALHGQQPLKGGDHVLIQGTGGVSIFALQFAVVCGAIPIVTSSSDDKLEVARHLGARHTINYKSTSNWDEEVLKITHQRGVDIVVECAGTLKPSMNAVKHSGQISIIGLVAKEQTPPDIIVPAFSKAITFRGISVGSVAQFKNMIRLIEAHPDRLRPVVDKVFSFEEAGDAFDYLKSQKHIGKIVINVV